MSILTLDRVVIAYPSGNTTAIVFGGGVAGDGGVTWDSVPRAALNAALICAVSELLPEIPPVEQCCVIVSPERTDVIARLSMFGGEFCGNAARSAVRVLTAADGPAEGFIEVSGALSPLGFTVNDDFVHIEMPLPALGCSVEQVAEGSVVQLDGIVHLVVTDRPRLYGGSERNTLAKLLKENAYGFGDAPAAGVSYYDEATKKSAFCVYVREVETMYDETACGSGTCSIGAALAARDEADIHLSVIQPSGGQIQVSCKYGQDGLIHNASIGGKVEILYDGPVNVELPDKI